ncbi:MAG: hypothetical protein MJ105_04015 [Lachnospiraceae bacterium]|nr:hypothetical protein [Lachnospiraceae bacterium]
MISEKCAEVYKELLAKGFQESLCREIAYKYVNTDYTATRMLGYLYRRSDPTEEEVVDEMIAILSDRDRIVQKHRLEEAQAAMNQVIREGLPGRNDEDE